MKKRVLAFCGPNTQTLMLKDVSSMYLEHVKQFFIRCPSDEARMDTLIKLYKECNELGQTMIFCTKRNMKLISERLVRENLPVSTMSAELTGEQRDDVMAQFKGETTRTLITTDVLSRGVDVPNVTHVINFGLATKNYDGGDKREMTYQQRVGRKGCCISLLSGPAELAEVEYLNRQLRMEAHPIGEVSADDDEEWEEKFGVQKSVSGGESKN